MSAETDREDILRALALKRRLEERMAHARSHSALRESAASGINRIVDMYKRAKAALESASRALDGLRGRNGG